jgi:hypothetical protein
MKSLACPSPLHLNRIGEFSADTGAARLFGFTGLNVLGAGGFFVVFGFDLEADSLILPAYSASERNVLVYRGPIISDDWSV